MRMSSTTHQKAAEVFEKFCDKLLAIDMKQAILVPAAVGVTITMVGIFQEAHGQSLLAQHGGLDAINAYKAALEPVVRVTDFVKMGLLGQLHSFGGNAQGTGVGVTVAGPVLAMTAVMMAKTFHNIKKYVTTEVEKIRGIQKIKAEDFHDLLIHNPTQAMQALRNGLIAGNAKFDGVSTLSRAISLNHIDIARELIARGANVNEYTSGHAQLNGMTPIHFSKSAEAIHLLVDAGADVDAPFLKEERAWIMPGETMLQRVAGFPQLERYNSDPDNDRLMAEALIKSGADSNRPYSKKEYKYGKNSVTRISDRVTREGLTLAKRLAEIGVSDVETHIKLKTSPPAELTSDADSNAKPHIGSGQKMRQIYANILNRTHGVGQHQFEKHEPILDDDENSSAPAPGH